MLKINFTLGRWQLAVAADVMKNSWKMVKKYKCKLSEALKLEWNKVKKLIQGLSKTYKQYKYRLIIEGKNYILKFKTDSLDNVINSCIHRIEKVKGSNFVSSIKEKIFDRYDYNLKTFKRRKLLTFADNIFVMKLNE